MMKNDAWLKRFGFVVSKKISKNATIRNRVKRRLSEAVRAEIKNIKTGTDLVIITLPGIEKKGFPEIKEAVNSALIKAKLINV